MIFGFNNSANTQLNFSTYSTLIDILCCRAVHQPNKIAYTFLINGETDEVCITYEELDRLSRAIAAQLQSIDAINFRALLLYPPGLEFIGAFFGCLYAGVVAVPAYPPRPNQSLSRLQAIVADAQATIALTTTTVLSNVERRFAEFPNLQALHWLATNNINSDLAQEWQKPLLDSNTLALLQYTSGSTGTPKGVMLNHGNLLHNSALIHECFQDTPDSMGVSWLPVYHDMGLIGGVLQPLYVGAKMTLMSPVDFLQSPVRWLNAISRYKATTSGGPNFAYDLCVRRITDEQKATLDLSSWEVAFNGAEPIRAETLERFAVAFEPCGFRKSAFYPCYGMAETTLIVSGGLKATQPAIKIIQGDPLEQNQVVPAFKQKDGTRTLVSCGQTRLDQRIVIAHPETLTRCLPDEVGEILVSGGSVAQGYWNRPEETEHTFKAYLADNGNGPFLRTGDLGFLQDGEMFITGRIKDLIIIRGRNHYPQDIELTVEQSHPALRISHGAAFSVDMDSIERLVIAQEVERSYLRNLNVNEIVTAMCQAVAQQHEIQVYAILLLKTGSIPKTSSGKIQRYACRTGFLNNSLDVVSDWIANPRMKAKFRDLQEEVELLEQQLLQPHKSPPSLSGRNDADEQTSCQKIFQQASAIQDWLVSKITEYLKVNSHEIDVHNIDVRKPLNNYGLDSVAVMDISYQLENWLGCRMSPTVLYEHPTIEELAQHLESMQTEDIIAKVDQLSDREVDLLLNKFLHQGSQQ
ncbi:MAG: AMP-binding protein [Nostoc sp.]|uniref:AMP-binding protein n=2 Tax=Nostoc sp. TaxID=1180 RepID=UPI002FFD42BF